MSDLISRQDAIDALSEDVMGGLNYGRILQSLPSADRLTGEWKQISLAKIYECSECGRMVMTGDIEAYKFCHSCGARMNKMRANDEYGQ